MFKNHPVTLANFLRPCHVSSRGLPLVTGRQSTFALGCDYKPSGRQGHVTTTSDHVFEPVTWKGLSSCGEKRHPETELYQANSLKAFLDPECFRRKKSLVSVMSFSKPPFIKKFRFPALWLKLVLSEGQTKWQGGRRLKCSSGRTIPNLICLYNLTSCLPPVHSNFKSRQTNRHINA